MRGSVRSMILKTRPDKELEKRVVPDFMVRSMVKPMMSLIGLFFFFFFFCSVSMISIALKFLRIQIWYMKASQLNLHSTPLKQLILLHTIMCSDIIYWGDNAQNFSSNKTSIHTYIPNTFVSKLYQVAFLIQQKYYVVNKIVKEL